ncbi:unnamed protein product [Didymodactylos carnosus]|uniref:Uncharacterized protein n=1 Tax=Didymodactylos carnosus TaxID=1234261 RepID=A0A816ARJ9_9BILA|nr:unnamed protein product [Didymodactylos carnosus]CAF1598330.1 unnamed protein product [Didymodactylos carnosus]CAF4340096.1 unnamed protein product [Didymodactylos carnosus]CAF4474246.1 unnamed protein product [Didymodactylos carnosus]
MDISFVTIISNKAVTVKEPSKIHFSDDEPDEELTTQINLFDDYWYEPDMEEKEDEQIDTSTDYWTDEQDELSAKQPFSVEYAYADASQNEVFGNTEEKTV